MSNCICYFVIDERRGDEICLRCGLIRPFYKTVFNFTSEPVSNDFIKTICGNNNIVKCIENEALLKFSKKNDTTNSFAAYCIYYACKKHTAARTLSEIAEMCFISQSEILKHENSFQSPIKPSDLTARACYRLGIDSFLFQDETSKLADELFNNLLINSPPQSVLAVAIFVLCSVCHKKGKIRKRKQNEIARACHISASCIRRLFRVYKEEILTLASVTLKTSN